MAIQNPSAGYFSMGEKSLRVPMALFKKNRQRLCEALRSSEIKNSVVVLQVTNTSKKRQKKLVFTNTMIILHQREVKSNKVFVSGTLLTFHMFFARKHSFNG